MKDVGESQDSYFKADFSLASTSQVQLYYTQATLFYHSFHISQKTGYLFNLKGTLLPFN